ncbi:MAG: cell division protein FtsZ [Clostridia bacterium]|nr:cell division protein FtsZ [Clostridia bacterium]
MDNRGLISNSAVLRVMGIGGGGCNAVNSMIESGVTSAEFYAVNTDNQALALSKVKEENWLPIGQQLTKGLGAGSDPSIGEAAAEESKDRIAEVLKGTDLLFIASGMGGGTGTGAAPVVARIARELGILTVAVVTRPFSFEGRVRNENANKGIANLRKYVDTLVVIPNDKLLQSLPSNIGVVDAFKVADDMLKQGIIGIVDLITTPSLINLDFADVNTVMRDQGLAHMGIGRAKGENRIIESVRQAVSSPLLETTIEGAKSVILNVTGGKDLMLSEISEAAELVRGIIDPQANIIFGNSIDEDMVEEVKITIIATGFTSERDEKQTVLESNDQRDEQISPALRSVEIAKENAEREENAEEETAVSEGADEQDVSEEVTEEKQEEKKKELPAFMRRLFGKK